jgi:hypothetical protein
MKVSMLGRLATLTDQLFGNLGLALQPDQAQRPVHRDHRLSALQPSAHHRVTCRLAAAFWCSAQVGNWACPPRSSSSVRSG